MHNLINNCFVEIYARLSKLKSELFDIQDYINQRGLNFQVIEKLSPIFKIMEENHSLLKNQDIFQSLEFTFLLDDIDRLKLTSRFKERIEEIKEDVIKTRHIQEISNKLNELYDHWAVKLTDNLKFFVQIGHIQENTVVIGSNGSGKTNFINHFISLHEGKELVNISAQRWLSIPKIKSIQPYNDTSSEIRTIQKVVKDFKSQGQVKIIQSEFEKLLNSMISDNIKTNQYIINQYKLGNQVDVNQETTLSNFKSIFESLFTNITITYEDGIELMVHKDGRKFGPMSLSDGEKTAIYLIAQVILSPKNSLIIIDEPEIHLHKLMVEKIWDRLEAERQDCKFIYLTHDLNFASSRFNSNKLWMKNFTYPNKWEIEPIPKEDEIPEDLIMEIIGSPNTTLFCEGESTSPDYRLFKILFNNYHIRPVGGCSQVSNYTRIVNDKFDLSKKAIGLIDADHRPKESYEKLKKKNVYVLKVAEIENLFLDEEILETVLKFKNVSDPEKKNKFI